MKADVKKELNELSPFLADLKKEDPFKTPKFYFDTLPDKVLEKARREVITHSASPQLEKYYSLTERINNWLSSILQPRYAVAIATVSLLIVAGWFFMKQQNKTTIESTADITKEEIHQYITENIHEFDENLIIEAGAVAIETEGVDLKNAIMNDVDIENYLKENINESDFDFLNNEL
jgi:hypothetical protein